MLSVPVQVMYKISWRRLTITHSLQSILSADQPTHVHVDISRFRLPEDDTAAHPFETDLCSQNKPNNLLLYAPPYACHTCLSAGTSCRKNRICTVAHPERNDAQCEDVCCAQMSH